MVDNREIVLYWRDYFYTHYKIAYKYFYWYYLGNGMFDWDAYNNRILDGPAYPGINWISRRDGETDPKPTFIWFWE